MIVGKAQAALKLTHKLRDMALKKQAPLFSLEFFTPRTLQVGLGSPVLFFDAGTISRYGRPQLLHCCCCAQAQADLLLLVRRMAAYDPVFAGLACSWRHGDKADGDSAVEIAGRMQREVRGGTHRLVLGGRS
jgi:hypothetical protein